MAFFTREDANSLKILVDHHKVIYRRNNLLSHVPHIGSHTVLKVKKCTDEYEYRDPVHVPPTDDDQRQAREDLESLAIVTDWKFTRTGCDHMVSCNPFYPKSKRCSGMPYSPRDQIPPQRDENEPPEAAFSFRTLNDQQFDACQPICYDSRAGTDNMIGVTSRFTFGKCRVYDPLMLAFYLDPTRRYVNPDTQILERKSFVVRDVLIEPYKDAVMLASIPGDYCDQYGETYKSDGRQQGIDMYKCADNVLVWSTSWLLGETIPKLAVLAYDKAQPYLTSGHDWAHEEESRYPPSETFLASREQWLKHVDNSKRPFPFPLRLEDLGIRRGTNTEWLVWTDEFSHLTDGRNDEYGGRLVEREKPVTAGPRDKTSSAAALAIVRSMTAGGRFGYTDPQTGRRHESVRSRLENEDALESSMLKALSQGVAEYQRILNEDADRSHVSVLGLTAGLAYGAGYGYVSHTMKLPSSFRVLKSAFAAIRRAPGYAKKVPAKMVGFWAAKASASHTAESLITRGLINRLKTLAFAQALGPLALVIDVVALVGLAVDIAFVLLNAIGVSTPTSRRENSVSDRRLYRLAQTEIEFNYRLYGTGNIELTPFRFVVNTPYVTPEQDVLSYMAVMPIVYTARELNSDGGRLKPNRVGEGKFELGEDGAIHYVKNSVRHSLVRDENKIASAVDKMLQTVEVPLPQSSISEKSNNNSKTERDQSDNWTQYYVIVLFIATCLIGYFYPSKKWTIALALLFSILSVAFPWVVSTRHSKGNSD